MNPFDRLTLQMQTTLEKVDGVSGVYSRGEITKTLTAVRGLQNQRVQTDKGLATIGNRQDYILRTADLVEDFGGKPDRGDRFTTATGTWEVQPESGGTDCWLFADPANQTLTIHTVRRAA